MHRINVLTETDGPNHWTYTVQVTSGTTTRGFDVTLHWSDYNMWSHGRVAPEKVVHAAFEFLLTQEPASSILQRFDCAVIRRYFPQVDQELPTFL